VDKAERSWKQKLWHLSNRHFTCEADAQSASARVLKGQPIWLEVQSELVSSEHHAGKGRLRKDAAPTMQWHIQATVSVKQPQVEQEARRKACFIVAPGVIMVLCLLVYRLAEHRLRTRLAETEQTLPDQLNRPTARPTMQWVFQCFEGIELLHIRSASGMQSLVLRLQPMRRLVLALLGPPFEEIYKISS